MWPDRVSNPGPLTYEPGALPAALQGPARWKGVVAKSSMVPQRPGPEVIKLFSCSTQLSMKL